MKSLILLFTVFTALNLTSLAVRAQATHPSENYPGKGGSADTTNAAPASPEAKNPSTGQQNNPSSTQPRPTH